MDAVVAASCVLFVLIGCGGRCGVDPTADWQTTIHLYSRHRHHPRLVHLDHHYISQTLARQQAANLKGLAAVASAQRRLCGPGMQRFVDAITDRPPTTDYHSKIWPPSPALTTFTPASLSGAASAFLLLLLLPTDSRMTSSTSYCCLITATKPF